MNVLVLVQSEKCKHTKQSRREDGDRKNDKNGREDNRRKKKRKKEKEGERRNVKRREEKRNRKEKREGGSAPQASNLCELFYDNGSTQSLTQSDDETRKDKIR